MRRCAFLTMDNTAGFVFDDQLAEPPLRDLGWKVDYVSWSDPGANWNMYEIVVPRTTWDYQHDLDRFLSVLDAIERSTARLANSLRLIRWNAHKSYLLELRRQGVPVVETIIGRNLTKRDIPGLHRSLGADEIIIKPSVGANADFTYRVAADSSDEVIDKVCGVYRRKEYLAQRFITEVVTEGEFSLIFFNGRLSHAIIKKPASGDFRVQEEHGGIISSVTPDPSLRIAGAEVMGALEEVPLYARVDLVGDTRSGFQLMELELIEPALYLRMDEEAPRRFAAAIDSWAGPEPSDLG